MTDGKKHPFKVLLVFFVLLTLIVVPPVAINGSVTHIHVRATLLMVSLALAIGIWSVVSQSLLVAASGLYKFETLRVGRLVIKLEWNRTAKKRINIITVLMLFLSATTLVYSFAILYGLIALLDSSAFSANLGSFISALYFSVLAITNSLQEGFLPVSDTARLLTIIEMALGMLYALFFFSYLAAFIREGR